MSEGKIFITPICPSILFKFNNLSSIYNINGMDFIEIETFIQLLAPARDTDLIDGYNIVLQDSMRYI